MSSINKRSTRVVATLKKNLNTNCRGAEWRLFKDVWFHIFKSLLVLNEIILSRVRHLLLRTSLKSRHSAESPPYQLFKQETKGLHDRAQHPTSESWWSRDRRRSLWCWTWPAPWRSFGWNRWRRPSMPSSWPARRCQSDLNQQKSWLLANKVTKKRLLQRAKSWWKCMKYEIPNF